MHWGLMLRKITVSKYWIFVNFADSTIGPVWSVWMFLFMINSTSSTYLNGEQPISHCAAFIWICPLSHQSLQRFKWMQFKVNLLCTMWIRGSTYSVPDRIKYSLLKEIFSRRQLYLLFALQNLWICAVNEEILKNVINIHTRF